MMYVLLGILLTFTLIYISKWYTSQKVLKLKSLFDGASRQLIYLNMLRSLMKETVDFISRLSVADQEAFLKRFQELSDGSALDARIGLLGEILAESFAIEHRQYKELMVSYNQDAARFNQMACTFHSLDGQELPILEDFEIVIPATN